MQDTEHFPPTRGRNRHRWADSEIDFAVPALDTCDHDIWEMVLGRDLGVELSSRLIHMLMSKPQVPQNVTLLGDRVFTEVIKRS